MLQRVGVKSMHLPCKGNAPAIPDVLGVTSATRIAALPDVQTIAEQGVPGYSYYTWVALYAPAGTPPDVPNRLYEALNYAKANPAIPERFKADGMEPVDMTPGQFMQFLAKEVEQNHKIDKDLGFEKQ